MSSVKEHKLDKGLLLAILTLIGVGLVQVYSSSYIYAIDNYGNGHHFFLKQVSFAIFGIGLLFFFANLKWKFAKLFGYILLLLSLSGLILTLIPGIGVEAGGAHRWIQLPGGFRFEPSELLKVTFPLFIALLMVTKPISSLGKFDPWVRFFLVSLPFILLHKQPDFGTLALLFVTLISILFVFGLKWRHLLFAGVMAVPALYFLVFNVPYRMARIKGFLDPWADPTEKGFQILQSLMSFQSGGVWGAGLGQGQGKLFFLPEAHTDFTLAVLGEEMGLIGFLIVLMIYGYIVFRGLQISAQVERDFEKIVALGITSIFAFQVFTNMGVVLGLLPTKGLTLPFLSYGGSSLIATCIGFGWLLNIERMFGKRSSLKIIRNGHW
ncbi:MAG: putative lipid II flippase FtsW [Bdellovibrionales bacterium]|nr:putative lipid II flippase FtsW [Bdellovibrionales bacterium]